MATFAHVALLATDSV